MDKEEEKDDGKKDRSELKMKTKQEEDSFIRLNYVLRVEAFCSVTEKDELKIVDRSETKK